MRIIWFAPDAVTRRLDELVQSPFQKEGQEMKKQLSMCRLRKLHRGLSAGLYCCRQHPACDQA